MQGQNVGVGTANPLDLLHIKDGQLRLEGNNKYLNFHTESPNSSGMRFYTDGLFKGAWFYNSNDHLLNLTSNGNIDGLIYRLNDNKMLLGRDFVIGSERFGIRSTTNSYGGMYMETSGENGKPFYGYATDSIGRAWHYYDGASQSWRLYNVGDRLTVSNTGNVGIGTVSPAEKLHLLGNLRLDGALPLLQFYQQGISKAQIRHSSTSLYLNNIANGSMYFQTNNATKMTITGSGDVGIGTLTPEAKLQVYGDQWDLSSTDGVLMVGADAQRMAFGIATSGLGAGTGRIYSKGSNNRLILGGGTNDVLSVMGDTKRVGIGTNDPAYTLDINSEELRGIDVINAYSGSASKYGGRFESSTGGTGSRYGIYGLAYGTSGATATTYGGRFLANGNGNSGSVFGIYAQVSAPGTGNHYGIYTTANTANPGTNTRSWALYAQGHSYFSNDVRVGTLDGAAGYRLSVNGKIMSEELKVQMSENWPDYVFEEDYDLMSIDEIDGYIKENGHLPGVPSAQDVENENGIMVGEMNRILLEKVEELTLLLIEQNEKIELLEKEIYSSKGNN
jgi:hypothetical protein